MSAISQQPAAALRPRAVAALILAVFVVSIGYSVVLPLLPYLIERLLGACVQAAQVSRHTGLLTAVYAERALSGLFAAAVTPVAAAAVGALTATEQARARRLTFVSMAGISGSIPMPLAAMPILAFLAAMAVVLTVPRRRRPEPGNVKAANAVIKPKLLVPTLLTLSLKLPEVLVPRQTNHI